MPFFYYFDWTLLIVLPALFFSIWASANVNSTFKKYSHTAIRSGQTAAQAARQLLDANGLYHVGILTTKGHLTDHYDPRTKNLYLSESVYNSQSAASVGVACHEAGHAIQDALGYAPLKMRMAIIPACNIGSSLAMPLFFIGLLFSGNFGMFFMLAGIACFSFATLFQLITLPVEFNASSRALAGMQEYGIVSGDELQGARKVLRAAAMTYVAALATSLLSLLRLLVIANNRRN